MTGNHMPSCGSPIALLVTQNILRPSSLLLLSPNATGHGQTGTLGVVVCLERTAGFLVGVLQYIDIVVLGSGSFSSHRAVADPRSVWISSSLS
jgi:hypothetical protein